LSLPDLRTFSVLVGQDDSFIAHFSDFLLFCKDFSVQCRQLLSLPPGYPAFILSPPVSQVRQLLLFQSPIRLRASHQTPYGRNFTFQDSPTFGLFSFQGFGRDLLLLRQAPWIYASRRPNSLIHSFCFPLGRMSRLRPRFHPFPV